MDSRLRDAFMSDDAPFNGVTMYLTRSVSAEDLFACQLVILAWFRANHMGRLRENHDWYLHENVDSPAHDTTFDQVATGLLRPDQIRDSLPFVNVIRSVYSDNMRILWRTVRTSKSGPTWEGSFDVTAPSGAMKSLVFPESVAPLISQRPGKEFFSPSRTLWWWL